MDANLQSGAVAGTGEEVSSLLTSVPTKGGGVATTGGAVVKVKAWRKKRQVARFRPGSAEGKAAGLKKGKRDLSATERVRERIRKRLLAIVMEEMQGQHGNKGRRGKGGGKGKMDAMDSTDWKSAKGSKGVRGGKEGAVGEDKVDTTDTSSEEGVGGKGIDFGNLKIVYGLLLQDETAAWARERVLLEEARAAEVKVEIGGVEELQRVIRHVLGKEVEV